MMECNVFCALHIILLQDILKRYCENIFRNLEFQSSKFVNYNFPSFQATNITVTSYKGYFK
jgi:hypothetical protein